MYTLKTKAKYGKQIQGMYTMSMNHQAKNKDDELERMKAEFLAKGGEVTVGKTKAMANELGISNNTWNNKLSKAEKVARSGPLDD